MLFRRLLTLQLHSDAPKLTSVSPATRLRAVMSAFRGPTATKTSPTERQVATTLTTGSDRTTGGGATGCVELEPPLTTAELQRVLTRRLTNLQLPDDNHTMLAESFMTLITTVTSLFAKLYILNLKPVRKLPSKQPRLAFAAQLLSLSQLHPLRVLQAPLLRVLRPLQWLLVPFAAMATPLALQLTVHQVLAFLFSRRRSRRKKSSASVSTSSRQLFDTSATSRSGEDQARRPSIKNKIMDFVDSLRDSPTEKAGSSRRSSWPAHLPKVPCPPQHLQTNGYIEYIVDSSTAKKEENKQDASMNGNGKWDETLSKTDANSSGESEFTTPASQTQLHIDIKGTKSETDLSHKQP